MSQLGPLRELMLREARLLECLSHDSIMPLESGWLEQRAGEESIGSCTYSCCCWPPRGSTCEQNNSSWRLENVRTASLEQGSCTCGGSCGVDAGWRYPGSNNRPCSTEEGASGTKGPRLFWPAKGGGLGENVASFLLRSHVPQTAMEDGWDDDDSESESDTNPVDDAHKGNGCVRERGGQPCWGGDDSTDWTGMAEPKTPPNTATVQGGACAPRVALDVAVTEGGTAGCASDQELECHGGGGDNGSTAERTLCLASYILMPDCLPLHVWFEREFEPRTALSDEQGGGTVAVTTPEHWAVVWRQLLVMFLQVVRGVDYLHMQGVVHNNIHPASVWVSKKSGAVPIAWCMVRCLPFTNCPAYVLYLLLCVVLSLGIFCFFFFFRSVDPLTPEQTCCLLG